jgi:hypothetical protein
MKISTIIIMALVSYSSNIFCSAVSFRGSIVDFEEQRAEQLSGQCHGHKSEPYFNYPDCAPGNKIPSTHLVGTKYLYAVPKCQDVELYDIDKVWGGAHISLGKWNNKHSFEDLKTWLKNISDNGNRKFKKGSSWHPTKSVIKSVSHNTKCHNGSHLPWYMVHVNSPTLDVIHEHIINKNYATKMGNGELHISAVPSGNHKTKDIHGIENVIAESSNWVVALVEVKQDKNGKIFIERQDEAPILAIA